MNIEPNVVVDLYFWYQALRFVYKFFMPFMAVSSISSLIVIGFSLAYESDDTTYDQDKEIRKGIWKKWRPVVFVAIGLIVIVASIQFCLQVVLKVQIAKLVVPMGLDTVDALSKEVQAVWGLLKGLLSK